MLNQPLRGVGIVGYGAYVPRYRLPGTEISRVWTEGNSASPVKEKAVPGLDEDTATMRIVAEAIGATPRVLAADWQFACKAGTEAMQAAIGFVGSGMADYALSIGMD